MKTVYLLISLFFAVTVLFSIVGIAIRKTKKKDGERVTVFEGIGIFFKNAKISFKLLAVLGLVVLFYTGLTFVENMGSWIQKGWEDIEFHFPSLPEYFSAGPVRLDVNKRIGEAQEANMTIVFAATAEYEVDTVKHSGFMGIGEVSFKIIKDGLIYGGYDKVHKPYSRYESEILDNEIHVNIWINRPIFVSKDMNTAKTYEQSSSMWVEAGEALGIYKEGESVIEPSVMDSIIHAEATKDIAVLSQSDAAFFAAAKQIMDNQLEALQTWFPNMDIVVTIYDAEGNMEANSEDGINFDFQKTRLRPISLEEAGELKK